LRKIQWIAGHLEEMLGATLLLVMAVLTFANVITRYVFEYPLAFTEEIEVNALVWLTLFGTASAFRRKRHLRMLFFQDKLQEKVKAMLNIVIALMSASLFTCLGYLGYKQVLDERFLEITSESLNYPQWIYTVCIPIGCTLIVYRILEAAVSEMREK
jgi:TRAP-type C4-dicarboxylate transport system permease small subunit